LDDATNAPDSKDRSIKDRSMRNLKVTVSYDGAEFSGWQVQPNASTVQGTLASAIGRITGEKVLPQGSGRTDAGVHALAQVMTFVTQSSVPTGNFVKAMNDILPASVRVLVVEEAAPEFHARHSAHAKTYRYRIYRESICPPFLARYVWHYPYRLGEQEMQRAAELVVGEHDFTSFAAVDPERGHEDVPVSNVRKIFSSSWERAGDELVYTVRGSGISSPHGEESCRHVHFSGQGDIAGGGCCPHSRGAKPLCRRGDCARQWTVSGERRVLAKFCGGDKRDKRDVAI
jgi:tRNA pseudouridine38-40 synthase